MRMPQRRRLPPSPLALVRRFTRHAAAAAVLAACLLLTAAFVAVAVPGNAVAREASALRADITRLETDLASKQREATARQADQYVVDRAQELGFVRPNEALVTVRREADGDGRGPADTKPPSRLAKWLAVFFR